MSSVETFPTNSHEANEAPGSEVLDDFINRRNKLPEEIKNLKNELDTLDSEWQKLGGNRIDQAQAAVDALNFKSDAIDRIRAQTELRDAKQEFFKNMQNPPAATVEEAGTLPVPDSPPPPEQTANEKSATHGPYVHGQELVLRNGESFQKGWIVSEQLQDGGLRLKRDFSQGEHGGNVTSEYRDFSASELDDLANAQGEYADMLEDEAYAADAQRNHDLSDQGRQERRDLEDEAYAINEKKDSESSDQGSREKQETADKVKLAEESGDKFAELLKEAWSAREKSLQENPRISREQISATEAANDRIRPPAPVENNDSAPSSESGGDYRSALAQSLDHMAKFLSNKSENLEAKGGVKGIALRMLKRMGRGAYKLSGLEREVRGMKLTVETVKNRRDAARENRAKRKERHEEKRQNKKQERQERAQAKLEQEVMDYQEHLKSKAEAKARKNARKQARSESWNQVVQDSKELGSSVKEYLGASRTARIGRGALNQVRGVYGYVKGAAGAMHQAGTSERQRQMNS